MKTYERAKAKKEGSAIVHFVGAGPGAVDLITLRARRLLKAADVIIYAGSLINPELLSLAPEAELYDSSTMTLDDVISVMEKSRDGSVVRLHSGDPSVYGAIREQMDRLAEQNIPFDVCPGVSSFCAAAASLKTEYTLPGVSQTVVITRAAGQTPVPEGETTVLFLSAGLADKAQSELLKKYPPNTPAAIVYKASFADEKIFRCTAGTVASVLNQNGITNHALIIAGEVLEGVYENSYLYSDRAR